MCDGYTLHNVLQYVPSHSIQSPLYKKFSFRLVFRQFSCVGFYILIIIQNNNYNKSLHTEWLIISRRHWPGWCSRATATHSRGCSVAAPATPVPDQYALVTDAQTEGHHHCVKPRHIIHI